MTPIQFHSETGIKSEKIPVVYPIQKLRIENGKMNINAKEKGEEQIEGELVLGPAG